MTKKVTIKDLAVASGVSVTTVSQILNGKGDRFSEETKHRVAELQKKLGYVPDFNARNLIMKSARTIGVLVPDIANAFFSMFIKGIQDAAQKNKFVPIIFDANDTKQLQSYLEELIQRAADGLIIASATIDRNAVDTILKRNGIPYLLFDQNAVSEGDRVRIDDEAGGEMAANYLLEHNHERVTIVAPENPTENVSHRIEGFKQAFEEAGKSLSNEAFVYSEASKAGGYAAVSQVIAKKPSAVFTTSDEIAIGIYRGLQEQGYTIPEDISVIGYDDIDLATYITPKLTTVHQPAFEMGQAATELLINRLNNRQLPPQIRELPIRLVERESVRQLSK